MGSCGRTDKFDKFAFKASWRSWGLYL